MTSEMLLPSRRATSWPSSSTSSPQLCVLFLGDTSKARRSSKFNNFHITGFSTKFVDRAWDLSSSGCREARRQPKDLNHHQGHSITLQGCLGATFDVDVAGGSYVVILNTEKLPLVGHVELSDDLVRIYGCSICSSGFFCNSSMSPTW